MNDEPTTPIAPSDEGRAAGGGAAANGAKQTKLQDPKMTATAVAVAFVVIFALIAWTSSKGDNANLSSNQIPGQWSQQSGGDGWDPRGDDDWSSGSYGSDGSDSSGDNSSGSDGFDRGMQGAPPSGGMQGGFGGPRTGAS